MRVFPSPIARAILVASLAVFCSSAFGISLDQLRNSPGLTPRQFAAYFSEFEFKFHGEVQSPEVFLATRSGDCDDFATLAAAVLREKGYTPRLITVRMPGVTHVVCYIEETGSYLDYNNRSYLNRTVTSRADIESIAESVAKSYKLKWTSASEFTFGDGVKRLVATVLPMKKSENFLAGIFR